MLPPVPSRLGAQSHSRTTYEDISITAADELGRQERGMGPRSGYSQRLSNVYSQFDHLAQQVAEMINNDESPHDEAMEIEDFEVEVSASDDSGDEYDDNKEHVSVPTRLESNSEFETRKVSATKEPHGVLVHSPNSPSLSPQGHTRKTYHGFPSSPSAPVSSRHSPLPPQTSGPSPPPLPPRLSRPWHDNRELPPQLPSSSPPDPSSHSPLPPRPPKPYHVHKREAAGAVPMSLSKAGALHGQNNRSASEPVQHEWKRSGSEGEFSRKADMHSTAHPVVTLPTPAMDQLATSPSGGHKATE